MRSTHLVVLGFVAAALIVALLLVVAGGDRRVAAADLRAGVGVGPDEDVERLAAGDARAEQTRSTRSVIEPEFVAAAAKKRAPRPKPRVLGRVVDRAGRGLAGARVWISTSAFWARLPLDLEPEALPDRWLAVARVECDAEGRFVVADLGPGRVRLVARASGFAPAYGEELETLRGVDVTLPDVVLEPGATASGIVLGPAGRPAPGVRVLLAADSLAQAGSISIPGRGVPLGATDAAGRFRVDELAPGPFELLFLAEGLSLARAEGRVERAGEIVDGFVVRLEEGVAIAGRVTTKGAAVLGELRVVARRVAPADDAGADGESAAPRDGAAEAEARPRTVSVTAEGTFRIENLLAGERYRLSLAVKRGESWRPAGGVGARTVRAPDPAVEFLVEPETAIVARVVDDATSEPLEDLVVWWGVGRYRALRDDQNSVLRAFPRGEVRCTEARPRPGSGRAWLRVAAPGYQDFERKDVPLTPGVELDLGEVRLRAERRLVVTVVDPLGEPVEGARVLVTLENAERLESWSRTPASLDLSGEVALRAGRTRDDGTVELSAYPGQRVRCQASAPGSAPSEQASVVLPVDGDHALTLALRRGASVVVRVRDGVGRPVSGVPIGHRLPRRAEDRGEDRFGANLATDPRGEARFEALDPGVHAFRVQQEDGESAWWGEDEGQAAREEPWQELVLSAAADAAITLVAPARGTLHGVVREGGRPLPGAVVKLAPWVEGRESGWAWSGSPQDPFASTTNQRGEYRIESRRSGSYVILVHHPDRRMPSEFRVELGAGEQVQDLTLETNEIRGRVTDPEGRPLAGVRLVVARAQQGIEMQRPQATVLSIDDRGQPTLERRPARGNREARTDAQGAYVLRGLVENVALVVASQGDDVENRSLDAITLAPGEVRGGVDFVLRRAGRVQVELAGPLLEDHWYLVEVVRRESGEEAVVRQVWLGTRNRGETIGSIVAGSHWLRLTLRDRAGRSTRLGVDTPVDVEVGKVIRVALQVP